MAGRQVLIENESVAGVFFRQDEGAGDHVLKGQLLPFRIGMRRGGHENDLLRLLEHLHPLLVVHPLVEEVHQVDGIFVHAV